MAKLIFVPTPIGNLEDITLRALHALKEVEIILAEKPTKTLKLLSHFQIKKSLYPYFEGKNERYLNKVLQTIEEGKDVAFVSEAGTPGIADPGQRLVNWAIENDIEMEFLPGASALGLAISASGFNANHFSFFGFLPKKGRTKIKSMIQADLDSGRALVFFFSPYRLQKDLQFLLEISDADLVLIKEATKMHEQIFRGKISEVLKSLDKSIIKGEWTGIITLG